MTQLDGLSTIFPPERFVCDAAFQAAFESDGLTAFRVKPLAVVIPETADEVIGEIHERAATLAAHLKIDITHEPYSSAEGRWCMNRS